MRWLARYVVRRMVAAVAVIVAAALLNLCSSGSAHAQAGGPGSNINRDSSKASFDQGEAYSLCAAAAAAIGARLGESWLCDSIAAGPPVSSYLCHRSGANGGSGVCGAQGSYTYWSFGTANTCAARNANALADAALWYTEPSTCIGGCQVQGTAFSSSSGGVKTYGMRDRTYNGSTCSPAKAGQDIGQVQQDKQDATQPKQPECTALGSGQTGCVKPNGDYCATASTGKTFCWTPSEVGKKTDGADAQVKSVKGDPVTPPTTAIADQEWQRKEGHQQTSCTGSSCTTYNVTNFSSVPAGTAKNSSGDNNADGSGNTSGNGKSDDGKKSDDDSEDSATDSGNCDAPPVCVGDTLKCLQLKFTWKIQCNTQGNEVSNGNGCGEGDVPVCAGKSCKAEAYAQVIQQWKQRCAMEALGQGNAERAAGISNGDDAGVVEGIWGGEPGGSGMTLRQDLVSVGGGGGSLLPDVEIEGQHWNVPQGFYDAIAAVRMVIIAMCTVIAMFVVGRNI